MIILVPVQSNTYCEKENFSIRFTPFKGDMRCLHKMDFIVLVKKQARVVEAAGEKMYATHFTEVKI